MKEETLTAVEIMKLADGKYAIYQRKDGSTFATRHNAYWRDLTGDHLIANLVQRVKDHEEVEADHKRLVRELDVALNGEAGAAKQASLCDIVAQVKRNRK